MKKCWIIIKHWDNKKLLRIYIYLQETHSIQDVEGVILMFSWDHPKSLDLILEYLKHIQVPAVICGNKVDLKHHSAMNRQFQQLKTSWKKHDLSAKSNYNFEKPIVELLRSKFGNDLTT